MTAPRRIVLLAYADCQALDLTGPMEVFAMARREESPSPRGAESCPRPPRARRRATPQDRTQAPMTADEASEIVVQMAKVPGDGPTGQFVDRAETVAW